MSLEHNKCNTVTVDLITETATKSLTGGESVSWVETLDKGVIHGEVW